MSTSIDQLIKEVISFEWSRLDRLRSETAFQGGISMAFAGGITFACKNGVHQSVVCLPSEIFLWLSIVGFVIQVFCLIKAWHGYTYRYLPQPNELRSQFDQISKVYARHYEPTIAAQKTSDEYNRRLAIVRQKMAQRNHLNNNCRSGWLHRTRLCLIFSLFPLAMLLYASIIPVVVTT